MQFLESGDSNVLNGRTNCPDISLKEEIEKLIVYGRKADLTEQLWEIGEQLELRSVFNREICETNCDKF